jgi:polyphosphate kinase 2 (PPK2 family)
VLFDRSWYNRAGVERVMGFCEPNDYLEFMRQTPEIERMLVRSGIRLLQVLVLGHARKSSAAALPARTRSAQALEAVAHRQGEPDKWDDYTEAKEAMFFYTDTADAPWTVIKSNDKKRARLNCMLHFLHIGGNGLRDCLWKRRQCGASFFVRVPHTKIY